MYNRDVGATEAEYNFDDKSNNPLLYRLGSSYESATRLGRKAAEAEPAIGIHGVSVSESIPQIPASVAARRDVEQYFSVYDTPTRNDLLHRTVELPKPVTIEIADVFNNLFGRTKR